MESVAGQWWLRLRFGIRRQPRVQEHRLTEVRKRSAEREGAVARANVATALQ